MSETVLEIVKEDENRYILHFQGRRFGILRDFYPHVEWESIGMLGNQWDRYQFNIEGFLMEEEPPTPAPKRKASTHLGLRRPK